MIGARLDGPEVRTLASAIRVRLRLGLRLAYKSRKSFANRPSSSSNLAPNLVLHTLLIRPATSDPS